MNSKIWDKLLIFIIFTTSCSDDQQYGYANETIIDSSNKSSIQKTTSHRHKPLGDTLFLGFRVNMTPQEFENESLRNKEININDNSITITLPFGDGVRESKFIITPVYNGSYLEYVSIQNDERSSVQEMVKILEKKYGKGDNLFRFEGDPQPEKKIDFEKDDILLNWTTLKNDITLHCDYRITITYKSLAVLKKEENERIENKRKSDSVNRKKLGKSEEML